MTGHICPECGTDKRPGAGPGCACAAQPAEGGAGGRQDAAPYGADGHRQAGDDAATAQQGAAAPHHLSDAERTAEQQRITEQHHAERSADMAAAEDFDPLRIRPYVTLGGEDAATGPSGPPQGHAPGQPGDAAATMPLFLDPAGPASPQRPGAPDHAADPSDATLLTHGPDPVQPRRRRPFAALVAGVAVVTVVGTAAFVGGLFNGDRSQEADLDQALPSTVTSLPEESTAPSGSASASASSSPSRSASGSPSASASASRSASPSPSASASRSASASASSSPSAAASSPAATAGSSAPAEVAPPAQPEDGATLRRGDEGPEVAELQRRLQEAWVLNGPLGDTYTERVEDAVHEYQIWRGIQGDPEGVYGPNTRRVLEAATTGQGRH
ncbi:peptidoglycan-binding protein [Streptomyces sp. A0642]|uniref:peptidoglycan-binding domain-containing protein n=1 Tax=Streptomyces sp. A0642 TaxID=2563100 RepID=UPI0010A2141C|nr:peptidoglycan-binding domain-containing protein [Streptomyces sp. A0642]THA78103.1 peptidoglycan-binding protein [Streptomyces sp. A0642]